MNRIKGWESRLAAYIESHLETEFSWGQHDCAMFAAGAVIAMTEVDLAGEFRGAYCDARTSQRALRMFGNKTLRDTVSHYLGAPVSCAELGRGDIALVSTPGGDALAVIIGSTAAVPNIHGGLCFIKRGQFLTGWKV